MFVDFSLTLKGFLTVKLLRTGKGLKIVIYVPVGVITFIHSNREAPHCFYYYTNYYYYNKLLPTTATTTKTTTTKKHVLLKCLVSSFYISDRKWSKENEFSPLHSFSRRKLKLFVDTLVRKLSL